MSQNEVVSSLVEKARTALQVLEGYSQEQVDDLCKAVGQSIAKEAELLAKEAIEETDMGKYEDKIQKNLGIGAGIWSTMKNQKSVGIIERDTEKNLTYVANPKGVIASVIPTTNPTLTIVGNVMMAVKGRNTVIISPHPRAKNVSKHTVDILNAAMKELGAPDNIVQIIEEPSLDATNSLMQSCDIVVATGGPAMLNDSLYGLRPRGTSAIVGVVGEVTIDIYQAILIECKRLVGIVEGSSNPKTFIPELIDYYKQGQFPFDKLINVYPFEDINQAFEDSKTGVAIKPVLKMVD
ncbi:aldehyde dehydrogenase family protein [Granulicatella sp. s8]|uniref:Aldehyde dehydrogenase family protein n=2 Tax=Granulicatella seriolae TaxID=2967226 RepID=A0ABT1WQN8_9LACT